MSSNVCMTKKSAIVEHENLVRVLKSGSKREQTKEAADQAKELSGYRKKGRKTGRSGGRK